MASLNKVLLIGNLTRPPELRYTPSGTAVADLRLAVNRNYTTQSGEKREEACFLTVIVWGKQVVITENWFPQKEAFIQQILGYTGQPPDDFVSAFTLMLEQVFLKRWAKLEDIAPHFQVSGYGWKERVA